MAKRNVTIALDEDLARWIRVRAAAADVSMSEMLSGMLKCEMEKDARQLSDDYERAMRRFLAIKPKRMRRPGERLPTRDEMHER